MQIKHILYQHGKNIGAILACEYCGHEIQARCYYDDAYQNEVIPSWRCEKCGSSTRERGDKTGDQIASKRVKARNGVCYLDLVSGQLHT